HRERWQGRGVLLVRPPHGHLPPEGGSRAHRPSQTGARKRRSVKAYRPELVSATVLMRHKEAARLWYRRVRTRHPWPALCAVPATLLQKLASDLVVDRHGCLQG